MKKRILSLALVIIVLFILSSQALAASDISGQYRATSCAKDGVEYDCGDEYLLLNADGTGEVVFNGEVCDISWNIDDSGGVYFVDADGFELTGGVYADGIICGNYAGYDYIYEFVDAAGAAQSNPVEQNTESFSYYPTSCTKDGESYSCDGEYIVFNADGSGMVVFEGCAYGIEWAYDGTDFTFTDSMGNTLTGTLSDDVITASFHGYEYVYEPGYSAPILSLSPDTWGAGLPLVFDQAGILSENERSALQTQAERISETYSCNIHIVILDDMKNFSLSNSIETCAEEIRTGYSLGFGTEKDCMLLLMSMAGRDYDLCAYGDFGNASFTDYGKETLENKFLDNFGDNDWFGGFSDYLSKSDEILAMSAAGTPLDVGTVPVSPLISLAISLLLGFLIAFSVCMVIKQKMKAVKEKTRAEEYVADGGVNITCRYDQYTHTTESRVYDPPTKSSGGGGTSTSSSGHSHSSGKF